jgi:hypothetical protein
MRWALWIETHPHHVNGNVMVVPAQGDQIVRVVVAPTGSLPDVMGLETVSASASVDLASSLVAVQDKAADRLWDGLAKVGDTNRTMVDTAHDDSDLAGAQDLGESAGTDSRPQ